MFSALQAFQPSLYFSWIKRSFHHHLFHHHDASYTEHPFKTVHSISVENYESKVGIYIFHFIPPRRGGGIKKIRGKQYDEREEKRREKRKEKKGKKGENREKKREKKPIRGRIMTKSEKRYFNPNLYSTYLGEKYHFGKGGGRIWFLGKIYAPEVKLAKVKEFYK